MSESTVAAPAGNLIDIQELAKATGLPVSWLKKGTKDGRIPGLRVGMRVLYNLDAVRSAVAKAASEPVQQIDPAAAGAPRGKKGPAIVQVSTGA